MSKQKTLSKGKATPPSGKASEEALSELHGALAKEFTTMLKGGDLQASTLNVIRQFLKDNEITAPQTPKSPLGDLTGALPTDFEFAEDED
jgi:hypothetical protein